MGLLEMYSGDERPMAGDGLDLWHEGKGGGRENGRTVASFTGI